MRYSTNILTGLFVFGIAAAANAQGFGSFYAPTNNNSNSYRVTPVNYQYTQPIRFNQPCLTGNCQTSTIPGQVPYTTRYSTPYTTNVNYGLSPACANGQCQHPQHQNRFSTTANCPNGYCGLNCCPNGQCLTGQCLNGQCPPSPYSTYRRVNGTYGVSTIPASPTYNNHNSVTTIPTYDSQSYRPATNTPYYN